MASRNPTTFDTGLESYKVIGVIGEGGSGRVFVVEDGVGDRFAVKCLRPDLTSTEKRKRFKNELAFCAKVDHPNIVKVLGSGPADWGGKSTPFYVMPLYEGTLEKDIAQRRITVDNALRVFDQILSGVEAAHRRSVFHRDLKPANILRDGTDTYVVADFGIARFEEDQLLTAVETKAGSKLLNVTYSAPEQRQRGAAVDHRADIFALGLMLNELFTGMVPEGTGHLTISSVAPQFGYLDELVDLMRRQDPQARLQSIDAVKKELLARGNDFVRLQDLDNKRKEVVPAFRPEEVWPVDLTGAAWLGSTVELKLGRAPESDWVQAFYSSRSNSYQMGLEPTAYRFANDTVIAPARDEKTAQVAIDQFKRWSPEVTGIAQSLRNRDAEREEQAARQKVARELAERERIAQGNRALKF